MLALSSYRRQLIIIIITIISLLYLEVHFTLLDIPRTCTHSHVRCLKSSRGLTHLMRENEGQIRVQLSVLTAIQIN